MISILARPFKNKNINDYLIVLYKKNKKYSEPPLIRIRKNHIIIKQIYFKNNNEALKAFLNIKNLSDVIELK